MYGLVYLVDSEMKGKIVVNYADYTVEGCIDLS